MSKYRSRLLLGFGVAFSIYLVLLLFTNAGELVGHLRAYPWILLFPLVALKLVSWVFRFGVWHYYLGVIGARGKISLLDSAVIFLAGFTMVVSPGKMAEVLKAVVVKVKTGIPVAVAVPVIVAERVVDGIAVLAITLGAVVLAGSALDLGPYRTLIVASAIVLAAGLIAVQIRPLAAFLLDLSGRLPLVRRLQAPLTAFYASSRQVLLPRHLIPTALLGTIAYVIDSVGFMLIVAGFGVPITWTLFLQMLFIEGCTSALGALSGVPNGAGVTEISSGGMLLALVAPANPALTPSAILTAAIIEGFFQKWFRVLVGMVVAWIFRRRLFSSEVEQTIAALDRDRNAPRPAIQPGD